MNSYLFFFQIADLKEALDKAWEQLQASEKKNRKLIKQHEAMLEEKEKNFQLLLKEKTE